jgi:hypothetical protein
VRQTYAKIFIAKIYIEIYATKKLRRASTRQVFVQGSIKGSSCPVRNIRQAEQGEDIERRFKNSYTGKVGLDKTRNHQASVVECAYPHGEIACRPEKMVLESNISQISRGILNTTRIERFEMIRAHDPHLYCLERRELQFCAPWISKHPLNS